MNEITRPTGPLSDYALEDRYTQTQGRVFLTGTQALVRILLDQARRDRSKGLKTGGFVSGYRGSPLGWVDQELWKAKALLDQGAIEFLPAINEDLAATAVLGSQQVETNPAAAVDGVFALWYGKGPGVDRAGDALKHGNAYGSSPHGGVLVVAGDDHGCASSSMPHQSDVAFMSWFMPTLNPASVSEYLAFGEYGYALSRYSGMWVGFKAVSETVESGQSVEITPDRDFIQPALDLPADGLHYRWPDLPGPQIEDRMAAKKKAVWAFAEANPIDRKIYDIPDARYGIVTTGKGHLDLMEALTMLGLDEAACRRLGLDVYKVGMVWPLPRRDALAFVSGKQEVMVIEEKRGIIESQLKEYFYDWPGAKPARMVGKRDENGDRLVPWTGELSPLQLVSLVAARLDKIFPAEGLAAKAKALTEKPPVVLNVPGAVRTPYFCSGCPHNSSTKVPDGSQALAGIGCHFMASWMPERKTSSLIQMGGEGVNWVASSLFTGKPHVFQNLGEGTWYHSGSMAIRQAVAAGANITYKILYNDAVAMTGGQPVDGPVSVQAIAQTCRAEGVKRIALVSDDPLKFDPQDFPVAVSFHHRDDLDAVQRELREIAGVTVLIYEQTCATEKRRRRKRGLLDDPKTFAVINPLVCEGCGDCSVESNCLSVEPLETEFGRKRQINLSNCNKDFSCLKGFCPSFVTVEGATRRKKTGTALDLDDLVASLPQPALPSLAQPHNLLVTGVGGTGVVTIGALITMAAHLEGKGASVLDFTGFAQKFGTVLSFIRLAKAPSGLNQVRIDTGQADAVIGCDIVVSSSPKASVCYGPETKMVLNLAEMPTGDLVLRRDADLRVSDRQALLQNTLDPANLWAFDANRWAETLLGDSVYANVMMLGYAWQQGLVAVSLEALLRAVELNGVAIEANKRALALGRVMAAKPDVLKRLAAKTDHAAVVKDQDPAALIEHRAAFLTDYQNEGYATRYRKTLAPLAAHKACTDALLRAAAKGLFKLMAYKDEYEVARLHQDPAFQTKLREEFEGDFTVTYHLAPPLVSRQKDSRGRPVKQAYSGTRMETVFGLLSKMKGLRGGLLDPFARLKDRKAERELIRWYQDLITSCCLQLDRDGPEKWQSILSLAQDIRGYGPVKDQAIAEVKEKVNRLVYGMDN